MNLPPLLGDVALSTTLLTWTAKSTALLAVAWIAALASGDVRLDGATSCGRSRSSDRWPFPLLGAILPV